jgi:hypothetical protein
VQVAVTLPPSLPFSLSEILSTSQSPFPPLFLSTHLTSNYFVHSKIKDRLLRGEPSSCLDDAGRAGDDEAEADGVENGRGEGPGGPLWVRIQEQRQNHACTI